jgi:hypothetical protein
MTTRRATVLGFVSTAVLVVVWLLWTGGGGGRADLVGTGTPTRGETAHAPAPAEGDFPPRTAPSTTTTTAPPEPSPPRRLRIPALGVDSAVVPVGLEPGGAMEVPGANQAGWYLHGPRPGRHVGSAVIAAHVDFAGRRGVFFDLRDLQLGEEVVVVDESGAEHRFVVSERFQVDKDELPIPELFRHDGRPTVTLITCGGAFDPGARHYEDNIVVRAEPA